MFCVASRLRVGVAEFVRILTAEVLRLRPPKATRLAQLAPGTWVRVEVIGRLRRAYEPESQIGDLLL